MLWQEGSPYAASACVMARTIAWLMACTANAPTASGIASHSPVDITKTVSPSLIVCTGKMVRA